MKSRIHPTYKTKYHVQNWASYDRALVRRGDITLWLSPAAIAAGEPDGAGTRGGKRKHSDVAIESALTLRRVARRGGLQLIIDTTGLSIAGAGEWAAAKHGGRGTRGWKTLQVGVDHASVIVAHALTEATVDDATTGVELIATVTDNITRVTADAAYDTVAFYTAASARGATVVVPPAKTARVSRRLCQVRHRRADRATRSDITTRLGHIIVGVSRASFC